MGGVGGANGGGRSDCSDTGPQLMTVVAEAAQDQERNYNLGRAFHAIGLVHLAVPYYERVLAYYGGSDHGSEAGTDAPRGGCGLRREAAHNLVHIYRASGSIALARQIMRAHLTI